RRAEQVPACTHRLIRLKSQKTRTAAWLARAARNHIRPPELIGLRCRAPSRMSLKRRSVAAQAMHDVRVLAGLHHAQPTRLALERRGAGGGGDASRCTVT